MSKPPKNDELSTKGLLRRIPLVLFDAAVLKVALVVIMFAGAGFGWYQWSGKSEEKQEEEQLLVPGNLGFQRQSSMLGLGSEIITFEASSPPVPPYSVMVKGQHKITFSVKASYAKGGVLGFGKEQFNWIVRGTIQAGLNLNAFYALLDGNPEDVLEETVLPVIRECVQQKLVELDLQADDKVPDVESFTKDIGPSISERLATEFEIKDAQVAFSTLHRMTDSERERDSASSIESANCGTLIKTVTANESSTTASSWSWLSWLGYIPVLIIGGGVGLVILLVWISSLFN